MNSLWSVDKIIILLTKNINKKKEVFFVFSYHMLALRAWHIYPAVIVFFSLFLKFGSNFFSSQEVPQVLEEVQCFCYRSLVVMWPLEEGTKLNLIMWQQNARKLEKMLR